MHGPGQLPGGHRGQQPAQGGGALFPAGSGGRRVPGLGEPAAQPLVRTRARKRRRPPGRVTGRNTDGRRPGDLGQHRDVAHHHRHAGRHRLQDREAVSLGQRREGEHRRRPVDGGQQFLGHVRHERHARPQPELLNQAGQPVREGGVGGADDDEGQLTGDGGQGPHENLVVLVRAVRADRQDEFPWQPVALSRGGHSGLRDMTELPDIHAVRHDCRIRCARVMTADFGHAGRARHRHRGCAAEHHRGDRSHPRLAPAAAGEGHVLFDRGVMHRHDERAWPQRRRERRVRDVQDCRVHRADHPRELPAAVRLQRRDICADHVGVRRQLSKREELLLAGINEHPQDQAVARVAHVRGELHHRPCQAVRAGESVDPRVDDDGATSIRHVSTPYLLARIRLFNSAQPTKGQR